MATVMVDAFNITQDRIARSRLAGDPPDIMIAPKLAKMGLFEFHRAQECIALGRQATERALPDILELLQEIADRNDQAVAIYSLIACVSASTSSRRSFTTSPIEMMPTGVRLRRPAHAGISAGSSAPSRR